MIAVFGLLVLLIGVVIAVHDGDTLKVKTDNDIVTVRLNRIDAPELKQPYGPDAQRRLAELVCNRRVEVEAKTKDKYGRVVGEVFVTTPDVTRFAMFKSMRVARENVNAQMVAEGFAWWYRKYAAKDVDLALAEERARKWKLGLWFQNSPVAPWDYRKKAKEKEVAVR